MESSIIRVEHGDQLFKDTSAMASLSKLIRNELGYPISSEPGQQWWIYETNEGMLIGFCSMIINKNDVHFCHDYIYPQFRNKRLYNSLFEERMYMAGMIECEVTAVATKMSLNTYLRFGFKIIKQSKNYTWLKLEAKDE